MITNDVYCFGAKFEINPHTENPDVILRVRHYIGESERKSSLLLTGHPLPRITVTRFHFPPGKVPTNIADIIHLDHDGLPLMIDLAPDDASEVLPVRRIFLYESGTHVMHCAICGPKMKYEELEHILSWCRVMVNPMKTLSDQDSGRPHNTPSPSHVRYTLCAESPRDASGTYQQWHIRQIHDLASPSKKGPAMCGVIVTYDEIDELAPDEAVTHCCQKCRDAYAALAMATHVKQPLIMQKR